MASVSFSDEEAPLINSDEATETETVDEYRARHPDWFYNLPEKGNRRIKDYAQYPYAHWKVGLVSPLSAQNISTLEDRVDCLYNTTVNDSMSDLLPQAGL